MTYSAKIEDLIQHRDSLIAQLAARDAEIAELRKVMQLAADKIRACDYTMARSDLLVAIARQGEE